ncbi:hepatitis A virus cellular receptor 1 homolog isoform X2 [Mugil cephalus]|uniref:hepatitis A virus cellular receptor 1 homolog isoform X2 n=1 Tax=Mugil cephalus TaxID=48193 RepID=UPI001FB82884|nr:hepatitis A virus cellular receptor 1 homolog isoform X2 [Mugil cephalus]
MRIVLLLALLSVSLCSSTVLVSSGSDVNLTCSYDIKKHGALTVCWGRGDIPNYGCNNQLIYTDGNKVTQRASSRYQLRGRLDRGDVSLTIENVTEDDSGRYGCRVMISGWFNDEKYYTDLRVDTATLAPTTTSSHTETPAWSTTANQTTGHMTSTGANILTSPFSDVQETEEPGTLVVVLVCVLFGSVVLVAALVVVARRCRRIDKIVQQQVGTSVQFTSTSSTLHLHSRGSAVENIYQIDEGGDRGGEYEYCP